MSSPIRVGVAWLVHYRINEKTRVSNASEVDDLNDHVAALTSEIELLDGNISSAEN